MRAHPTAVHVLAGAVLLAYGAACDGGGTSKILDIDPRVGHTKGEQPVKIVGQNFRSDIGYTIFFGTRKAGSVTMFDPETLVATTPSHVDPGDVDITIRADDGGAWRIPAGFKFEKMAGSVVGRMGEAQEHKKKGHLKF